MWWLIRRSRARTGTGGGLGTKNSGLGEGFE